jgi:4-amino-4-deoxy-L-arabinose transferase-like glycosyltransferase
MRRSAPLLAVAALWLAAAVVNVAWLRADNTPPPWDQAWHLSWSLMYRAMLDRWPLLTAWSGVAHASTYYPPFFHLCAAFVMGKCGILQSAWPGLSTQGVGALTNLAFMGVLLFATYGLAARCYGPAAGVFAAFLVAVYPILSGESRLVLLEYPLTALVALTLALLMASEGLTHPVWIWPLGIAAGLGMATKWSFAFVVLWPLIFAAADGARRAWAADDAEAAKRFAFNLLAVGVGCC